MSCVLYILHNFHVGFSVCVPMLIFDAIFHPRSGYILEEGRCNSSSLASFWIKSTVEMCDRSAKIPANLPVGFVYGHTGGVC